MSEDKITELVEELRRVTEGVYDVQRRSEDMRAQRTDLVLQLRALGVTDREIARRVGLHYSNISRLANPKKESTR